MPQNSELAISLHNMSTQFPSWTQTPEPRVGDIYALHESLEHAVVEFIVKKTPNQEKPLTWVAGRQVDSASAISHRKRRPCVVARVGGGERIGGGGKESNFQGRNRIGVYPMGTFEGTEVSDLDQMYRFLLVYVDPQEGDNSLLTDVPHVHTTPRWPKSGQYIVASMVMVNTHTLQERWRRDTKSQFPFSHITSCTGTAGGRVPDGPHFRLATEGSKELLTQHASSVAEQWESKTADERRQMQISFRVGLPCHHCFKPRLLTIMIGLYEETVYYEVAAGVTSKAVWYEVFAFGRSCSLAKS